MNSHKTKSKKAPGNRGGPHKKAATGPRGPRRDTARNKPPPSSPGFEARQLAVTVIHDVMVRGRSFDASLGNAYASQTGQHLESRDKALARLIAVTVLRRHGELAAVLNTFLGKPLSEDKGKVWPVLLAGAAQLLILDIQPHAAISLSVDIARSDPTSERFAKLVNAILRRVSETGAEILANSTDAARNFPDWLMQSWQTVYGEEAARHMAQASLLEPALDLSVVSKPEHWAELLDGRVLPSGTVRASVTGRIDQLPGFADGAWWVQDCAAAIPAKLFGDINEKRIADLCAAPGGKTLQLAARGAEVTSVDNSFNRLQRLKDNLARTKLQATAIATDVETWMPEQPFDGVLLDAPCTATGTIRRHPDILHLKRESDIAALANIQARLLQRAAGFVVPGGTLIYCTCSLQPEEGEQQIERFLERHGDFQRLPLQAGEAGIAAAWITPDGDLRTLPHLNATDTPDHSGIDGFYAARLVRNNRTS